VVERPIKAPAARTLLVVVAVQRAEEATPGRSPGTAPRLFISAKKQADITEIRTGKAVQET